MQSSGGTEPVWRGASTVWEWEGVDPAAEVGGVGQVGTQKPGKQMNSVTTCNGAATMLGGMQYSKVCKMSLSSRCWPHTRGDCTRLQRTTAVAVHGECPVKAVHSRVELSYHGSLMLQLVCKRRKEMRWQKLTKEFLSNCFEQRGVIFRMVFSLMVSNPRFLVQ